MTLNKRFRVPIAGQLSKHVTVDPKATEGAVLGENLFDANGNIYPIDRILNPDTSVTDGTPTDLTNNTTDDLEEGEYNEYFTVERAQDAVGAALVDSANIHFTYDDADNHISADLIDVAVTPGGAMMLWAFDSKGRLSEQNAATTDDLTEGADNLYYTDGRVDDRIAAKAIYNRIDAQGDIRIDANGDLRVTS